MTSSTAPTSATTSKPLLHPHKPSLQPRFRVAKELAAAGLANASVSFVLNPMDVTKVRMQTEAALHSTRARVYSSFFVSARLIVLQEGVLGLWTPGLLASMLRDLTYSSIRIGMYGPLRRTMGWTSSDIGLSKKIFCGAVTGAFGSAWMNPTDLVKIRFQQEAGRIVDGRYTTGLWKGQEPSYPHTFAAFAGIYRKYGFTGLYKGCVPTIWRAALVTSAQLSSYDHTKHVLKKRWFFEEGVPLHVTAGLVSGFCGTTACQPADLVKTRVMCDPMKKLYSGPFDCLVKTLRYEGLRGIFRGWTPSYIRLGPHFVISLPLFEQLRHLFGLGWFAT